MGLMVVRMEKLSKDYDLFIFDWDGTLNRMKIVLKIKDLIQLRALRKIFGHKNKTTIVPKHGRVIELHNEELENNVMSMFVDFFLFFSRTEVQKGTIKLMKTLKARGKTVAIFTNAGRSRIVKELRTSGVDKYVDGIVSAREIHAFKPDPTGINMLIKRFEAKRNRTIYMGDMTDDIIAARYAKVASCGISDGFDSYERLEAERPKYLFRTIEEFLGRI
jgi:phosphoglycolate phosphatase-like HAD superfamily hydrolase